MIGAGAASRRARFRRPEPHDHRCFGGGRSLPAAGGALRTRRMRHRLPMRPPPWCSSARMRDHNACSRPTSKDHTQATASPLFIQGPFNRSLLECAHAGIAVRRRSGARGCADMRRRGASPAARQTGARNKHVSHLVTTDRGAGFCRRGGNGTGCPGARQRESSDLRARRHGSEGARLLVVALSASSASRPQLAASSSL